MIVTFATGTTRTVTFALPATPSITAVMTAVPGTSPVTCPVCEIDATLALLVVQTTLRPPIATLSGSYGVATRSSPAATNKYTLSGATRTLDTRGGTGTTVMDATAD